MAFQLKKIIPIPFTIKFKFISYMLFSCNFKSLITKIDRHPHTPLLIQLPVTWPEGVLHVPNKPPTSDNLQQQKNNLTLLRVIPVVSVIRAACSIPKFQINLLHDFGEIAVESIVMPLPMAKSAGLCTQTLIHLLRHSLLLQLQKLQRNYLIFHRQGPYFHIPSGKCNWWSAWEVNQPYIRGPLL